MQKNEKKKKKKMGQQASDLYSSLSRKEATKYDFVRHIDDGSLVILPNAKQAKHLEKYGFCKADEGKLLIPRDKNQKKVANKLFIALMERELNRAASSSSSSSAVNRRDKQSRKRSNDKKIDRRRKRKSNVFYDDVGTPTTTDDETAEFKALSARNMKNNTSEYEQTSSQQQKTLKEKLARKEKEKQDKRSAEYLNKKTKRLETKKAAKTFEEKVHKRVNPIIFSLTGGYKLNDLTGDSSHIIKCDYLMEESLRKISIIRSVFSQNRSESKQANSVFLKDIQTSRNALDRVSNYYEKIATTSFIPKKILKTWTNGSLIRVLSNPEINKNDNIDNLFICYMAGKLSFLMESNHKTSKHARKQISSLLKEKSKKRANLSVRQLQIASEDLARRITNDSKRIFHLPKLIQNEYDYLSIGIYREKLEKSYDRINDVHSILAHFPQDIFETSELFDFLVKQKIFFSNHTEETVRRIFSSSSYTATTSKENHIDFQNLIILLSEEGKFDSEKISTVVSQLKEECAYSRKGEKLIREMKYISEVLKNHESDVRILLTSQRHQDVVVDQDAKNSHEKLQDLLENINKLIKQFESKLSEMLKYRITSFYTNVPSFVCLFVKSMNSVNHIASHNTFEHFFEEKMSERNSFTQKKQSHIVGVFLRKFLRDTLFYANVVQSSIFNNKKLRDLCTIVCYLHRSKLIIALDKPIVGLLLKERTKPLFGLEDMSSTQFKSVFHGSQFASTSRIRNVQSGNANAQMHIENISRIIENLDLVMESNDVTDQEKIDQRAKIIRETIGDFQDYGDYLSELSVNHRADYCALALCDYVKAKTRSYNLFESHRQMISLGDREIYVAIPKKLLKLVSLGPNFLKDVHSSKRATPVDEMKLRMIDYMKNQKGYVEVASLCSALHFSKEAHHQIMSFFKNLYMQTPEEGGNNVLLPSTQNIMENNGVAHIRVESDVCTQFSLFFGAYLIHLPKNQVRDDKFADPEQIIALLQNPSLLEKTGRRLMETMLFTSFFHSFELVKRCSDSHADFARNAFFHNTQLFQKSVQTFLGNENPSASISKKAFRSNDSVFKSSSDKNLMNIPRDFYISLGINPYSNATSNDITFQVEESSVNSFVHTTKLSGSIRISKNREREEIALRDFFARKVVEILKNAKHTPDNKIIASQIKRKIIEINNVFSLCRGSFREINLMKEKLDLLNSFKNQKGKKSKRAKNAQKQALAYAYSFKHSTRNIASNNRIPIFDLMLIIDILNGNIPGIDTCAIINGVNISTVHLNDDHASSSSSPQNEKSSLMSLRVNSAMSISPVVFFINNLRFYPNFFCKYASARTHTKIDSRHGFVDFREEAAHGICEKYTFSPHDQKDLTISFEIDVLNSSFVVENHCFASNIIDTDDFVLLNSNDVVRPNAQVNFNSSSQDATLSKSEISKLVNQKEDVSSEIESEQKFIPCYWKSDAVKFHMRSALNNYFGNQTIYSLEFFKWVSISFSSHHRNMISLASTLPMTVPVFYSNRYREGNDYEKQIYAYNENQKNRATNCKLYMFRILISEDFKKALVSTQQNDVSRHFKRQLIEFLIERAFACSGKMLNKSERSMITRNHKFGCDPFDVFPDRFDSKCIDDVKTIRPIDCTVWTSHQKSEELDFLNVSSISKFTCNMTIKNVKEQNVIMNFANTFGFWPLEKAHQLQKIVYPSD